MQQKIVEQLANIKAAVTAHNTGEKRVFLTKEDTPTNLTQFAYGSLAKGECSGMHEHPTMEEYFYFLKGRGVYTIYGHTHQLVPGVFVRIPAGVPHNLEAGDEGLEFVYFGVATQ